MILLDIALRGASTMALIMFAGLMWRAPIERAGKWATLALSITHGLHLWVSPLEPLGMPVSLFQALMGIAAFVPLAVTWLVMVIFLDGPSRHLGWFAAALVCSILYASAPYLDWLVPVCRTTSVLLFTGLLLLAIWTSRDDLVEHRIRARPAFAVAITGLGIVLTAMQGENAVTPTVTVALANSGGTALVAMAVALWFFKADMDRWPGAPQPGNAPQSRPKPMPADIAVLRRVRAAMDQGAWRREGLTIGALASDLGVPEHRLRRAINTGLGHRNFSSFVNQARIQAAKAQLRDPDLGTLTVLEICYDVGFSSLGPFNRAFKEVTGMSPTAWRRNPPPLSHADSEEGAPISANLH